MNTHQNTPYFNRIVTKLQDMSLFWRMKQINTMNQSFPTFSLSKDNNEEISCETQDDQLGEEFNINAMLLHLH